MGQPVASDSIQAQIQGEVRGAVAVGKDIRQLLVTNHGGVVVVPGAGWDPRPRRRAAPVRVLPRRFPGVLDRASEVQAASAMQEGLAVEVFGPAGVGRTTLLRHLAYQPETAFPDGVVHASAHGQRAADLLQFLYDAFYETDVPFKPTDAQIRLDLQATQALVLLDDVDLPREEIEALIDGVPGCAFVIATGDRRLWGDVRAIALGGLPVPDAVTLLQRHLGRDLTEAEQQAADAICRALGGHPLRVIQVAELPRPLTDVAREIAAGRSDAAVSDLVRASLSDDERKVLAVLAVMDGAPLRAEHLDALAGVPDAAAVVEGLVRRGLAQAHSPRYSVSIAVAEAAGLRADDPALADRVVARFGDPTAGGLDLPDDLPAVLRALDLAAARGLHDQALRIARALDGPLTLSGRWAAWERVEAHALDAARALRDRHAEAWALHQLGTRALCLDVPEQARAHLSEALALREAIGDQTGAAITRHNLSWLGPLPPPDGGSRPARPTPPPRPGVRPAWIAAAVAAVAVSAAAVWYGFFRPALAADAAELDLGRAEVRSETAPRTLTLTNAGRVPVRIGEVALAEGDTAAFGLDARNCRETTLRPGQPCAIRVWFRPSREGRHDARVRIDSDARDGPIFVDLTGAATAAPRVAVRPGRVDFGEVPVGTERRARVEVTNTGGGTLVIGRVAVRGGDLRKGADACAGARLTTAESCAVTVSFVPSREGPGGGRIEIEVESPRQRVSVALAGRGVLPPGTAEISRARVDFGPVPLGDQRREPVEVRHRSGGPLAVTLVTRPDLEDFRVVDDGCAGATLGPGGRCTVWLVFGPLEVGARSATLAVQIDGGRQSLTVEMVGYGEKAAPPEPGDPTPGAADPSAAPSLYPCRTVVLAWRGEPGLAYQVTVERATLAGGWEPVGGFTVEGTTFDLTRAIGPLGEGHVLRWRVLALDRSGNRSRPTEWRYFTCPIG